MRIITIIIAKPFWLYTLFLLNIEWLSIKESVFSYRGETEKKKVVETLSRYYWSCAVVLKFYRGKAETRVRTTATETRGRARWTFKEHCTRPVLRLGGL